MREGYKMTKLGEIPEDWEVANIGDVTSIHIGRDLQEENYSEDKKDEFRYPIYSNTVSNYGLYGYYNFVEYEGESVTVIGRGVGLGTAFHRNGKFGAIGRLIVLFPNQNLNYRYLAFYINYKVNFFVESSAIPQLTGAQIGKYKTLLPPLPEQRKIAEILSTVDEKIELIEQQISETQALKKGLMQRLLSKGIGHTDFKDSPLGEIPKEWEVVKLGEEAIIIMGQSPSGESYNKVGTGMPVLNGPTEFTNIHPIPVQFTTEVTKLASQGDILFCVRGSTTGRMNVADQTYCIGRGLAAIRGGENTSTKYIYYILQNLAKEVLRKAKDMGSTFPNVNSKELFQYKLALPSIDEQKKISDILNLSDQKLEILGERKEQMKEFKKGLMQKLLTGHIRVNSLLRKTEAS